MKFIVNEIPKSTSECPFSEWKPYPPIIEETGHYICKINNSDCNLCETGCKLLKAAVRCKDCKHGKSRKNAKDEDMIDCLLADNWLKYPDWFCADGERKDENN